jgi:AAA domain
MKSIDTPENRKTIKPLIVESTASFKGLLDGAEKYATIVLDHASGLQDLTLKEILHLDELPAQKSWGLATQQQYGQSASQCKELLRLLLSLDQNVVIVAQERTFGDEANTELFAPTVGAAMTPSVVGWLNPACDYVVQTFKRGRTRQVTSKVGGKDVTTTQRIKGVDYCLRCEPHDVYQTKFRIPKGRELPDVIVDPTYEKILAVVEGTE